MFRIFILSWFHHCQGFQGSQSKIMTKGLFMYWICISFVMYLLRRTWHTQQVFGSYRLMFVYVLYTHSVIAFVCKYSNLNYHLWLWRHMSHFFIMSFGLIYELWKIYFENVRILSDSDQHSWSTLFIRN